MTRTCGAGKKVTPLRTLQWRLPTMWRKERRSQSSLVGTQSAKQTLGFGLSQTHANQTQRAQPT
eukprot:10859535-Heterocapsa_arctica.AAC.1